MDDQSLSIFLGILFVHSLLAKPLPLFNIRFYASLIYLFLRFNLHVSIIDEF